MNRTVSRILATGLAMMLLLAAGISAFAAAPLTPEVAAEVESNRQQQEQRITPEKRKAAADALKAERLRIYQAKQAVKQTTQNPTDTK